MNEFRKLREVAAAKRDAAIKAAKAEHALTIQIAELEDRIRGTRRPRANAKPKTTLADTIYAVLPDDRSFTVDDVCGLITNAEPDRERSRATVNANLNRLLHAGAIKRLRHVTAGKPALFSLIDYDTPEAKTMLDWARELEGWEDLEPVELMVRMTENGFEMNTPPNDAVRSLSRELDNMAKRHAENPH